MKRIVAKNGVVYYRSDIIPCRHGFSTRTGGKSSISYTASLNLGIKRGDPNDIVLENLKLFSEALGIDEHTVISAQQIHSAHIRYVTRENGGEGYYFPTVEPCDGYIADTENITLGIRTADCVPILLYSPQDSCGRKIIAAVHAGWRGTYKRIASVAIEHMIARGAKAENICAAIGPCIGKCCYEVTDELWNYFSNILGRDIAGRFISPIKGKDDHYLADLTAINRYILIMCGVKDENIDVADVCTFCNSDEFYSHRYSGEKRGTMLSVISL